jgi:hypothetical protein
VPAFAEGSVHVGDLRRRLRWVTRVRDVNSCAVLSLVGFLISQYLEEVRNR